jgi:hypothetical protein
VQSTFTAWIITIENSPLFGLKINRQVNRFLIYSRNLISEKLIFVGKACPLKGFTLSKLA